VGAGSRGAAEKARAEGGDAHVHWTVERLVSAGLLVIVPGALLAPGHGWLDMLLAYYVPLHAHWGVDQVITDYVHGPRG
jgi:succinate dehydrogenase hydrophobic anchor subunit